MLGSCCGHNRGIGDIQLRDGRHLLILPHKEELQDATTPFLMKITMVVNKLLGFDTEDREQYIEEWEQLNGTDYPKRHKETQIEEATNESRGITRVTKG